MRLHRGGRVGPYTIHSIAVNGRRAILLAESMVRIEMLRHEANLQAGDHVHTLSRVPDRSAPQIVSNRLSWQGWSSFRGSLEGRESRLRTRPFSIAVPARCCLSHCRLKRRSKNNRGRLLPSERTHVGVPPMVVVDRVTREGTTSMTNPMQVAVTVGEPNWAPLEHHSGNGPGELHVHGLRRRDRDL